MSNNYNTEAKPLILPEYGRNVQNMVDYCMSIEDRAERQRCAETIVCTMSFFSDKQKEREDYKQVLWDHLYIMSDFKLDIDFPIEVTTREEYQERWNGRLEYDPRQKPIYRHYGKTIEKMIAAALSEENETKRIEMAKQTALQMKRSYVQWNKETVANAKIFADLFELSKGALYLDEMTCVLPDVKDLFGVAQGQNNHPNNNRSRKINIRRRNRK